MTEAELQPSLDPDPDIFPADVESDLADRSAEADLAFLSESSVAAETIRFQLMNRTELIHLQQSDTSLSLFESSVAAEAIPFELVNRTELISH